MFHGQQPEYVKRCDVIDLTRFRLTSILKARSMESSSKFKLLRNQQYCNFMLCLCNSYECSLHGAKFEEAGCLGAASARNGQGRKTSRTGRLRDRWKRRGKRDLGRTRLQNANSSLQSEVQLVLTISPPSGCALHAISMTFK